MSQQGCLNFFSAIVPNNSALEVAATISMLANSLDELNDKNLRSYVERVTQNSNLSVKEFEAFKTKILLGIYFIKWSNYNSTVAYYINKPLIDLFQSDLGIESLTEMDDQMKDESLAALSQYCSYVYENRRKKIYADLNRSLGPMIQADIHNTRNSKSAENSSWYGVVYTGIMRTLGINNMS